MKTLLSILGATAVLFCTLTLNIQAQGGASCATAVCVTNGNYTANNTSHAEQWYSYKPGASGTVVIQSCGYTNGDTYVYLYNSCTSVLMSNDDYCGAQSRISYSVTANTQYYILWTNTYSPGTYTWNLSGPTGTCSGINGIPSGLSFVYVPVGGNSAAKNFSVSATGLSPSSGNITVTPTAPFEISSNGTSGFSTSAITIPYSGGSLAGTTIYAIFHPTSTGTYSNNIVLTGGGAPAANVAVSGTTVYAPCVPQFNNMDLGSITSVTFGSMTHTRAASYTYPPYYDYTALTPVVVIPGTTYPLSVTWLSSASYTALCYVYFDWNNNAVLNDAGEEYYLGNISSSGTPTTGSTTITVPLTATTGVMDRMRVRVMNAYAGPCDQQWGEAQDYTINVVLNNNAPIAVCRNVSVAAGPTCQAGVSASQVDNGSYDPDGDPITFSLSPSGPYQIGTTPVTFTVTDSHTATNSCSASVTVVDNTNPVIATCAPPVAVEVNSNNQRTVADFTTTTVATDNCGVTSITQSPIAGTVVGVGNTPVTITVKDAANNQSTCVSTFSVIPLAQLSLPADNVYVAFGCGSYVTTLTRRILIRNTGGQFPNGPMAWSATTSAPDITINTASGYQEQSLVFTVSLGTLTPGTYTHTISISGWNSVTLTPATNSPYTLTVTIIVEPNASVSQSHAVSTSGFTDYTNSSAQKYAQAKTNSGSISSFTISMTPCVMPQNLPTNPRLRYVRRYFNLGSSSPSSNVGVRFYYTNSEAASLITKPSVLTIWQQAIPGGTWSNLGGISDTINNFVYKSPITSLAGQFIIAHLWTPKEMALTISSAMYDAKTQRSILQWRSPLITDAKGFFVERGASPDMSDPSWEIVGKVAYNTSGEYGFSERLTEGTYYYRVSAYDADGIGYESQAIRIEAVDLPSQYMLSQNYPNPFNPATSITYAIPEAQYVTLKVYDSYGREVKTLVDKEQTAGVYTVSFDASSLTSGIYFYKIQAGEFTQVKKMTLTK